jgi:hypothetical protein
MSESFPIGDGVMRLAAPALHWLLANGQTISYVLAAVSVFVAVLTYRKNSALERTRWLASLYSKFYEALDLKRIRQSLDDSSPNSPQVRELIRQEDAGFTDYLNFFEFMAYLEDCGQLSRRDVAALFDYYLRVLAKHEDVRQYIQNDRNGYGYLKKLLPRFWS